MIRAPWTTVPPHHQAALPGKAQGGMGKDSGQRGMLTAGRAGTSCHPGGSCCLGNTDLLTILCPNDGETFLLTPIPTPTQPQSPPRPIRTSSIWPWRTGSDTPGAHIPSPQLLRGRGWVRCGLTHLGQRLSRESLSRGHLCSGCEGSGGTAGGWEILG